MVNFINFQDWLEKELQNESSPFTRTRWAAFLGTGPDIPDASKHSRSTFPYDKKDKPKAKGKKKKKD